MAVVVPAPALDGAPGHERARVLGSQGDGGGGGGACASARLWAYMNGGMGCGQDGETSLGSDMETPHISTKSPQ